MQKRTICEIFSRVNGYMRPLQNWNDSKISEWKSRVFFNQDKFNSDTIKIDNK